MIRKVTVTKDKVPPILHSLALIKIAADVAAIEHHQYLDANYKSPIVHQKLKQVRENINWVSSFIHRTFLVTPDPEATADINFKLHEVMRLIMKLDEPSLEALKGALTGVVNKLHEP